MNSKQRILRSLNRQTLDRIPVDLWHTPEEVRHLLNMLGSDDGQGFICSSCRNIQGNTPLQNILAMVEAVKRLVPL
jgi:uroporphyrinogen-III decarboxylase